MATLRDVLVYFCSRYPNPDQLSRARLAKMAYLADWRSAIIRGKQITDTEWLYNHYGPYVREIEDIASLDSAFELEHTANAFGHEKGIIRVKADAETESLADEDIEILDYVINTTSPMYWSEFLKLIYSTYPILTQPRFAKLDLVELAESYERDRQRFAWGENSEAASPARARA